MTINHKRCPPHPLASIKALLNPHKNMACWPKKRSIESAAHEQRRWGSRNSHLASLRLRRATGGAARGEPRPLKVRRAPFAHFSWPPSTNGARAGGGGASLRVGGRGLQPPTPPFSAVGAAQKNPLKPRARARTAGAASGTYP